jgi:hypothetical protein
MRNLYLISQERVYGYDTYDIAVVAAESQIDARNINPSPFVTHITGGKWMGTYSGGPNTGKEYDNDDGNSWPKYSDIDCIEVEFLGHTAKERGVICSSFNA